MKKTCGALVISLLITNGVNAKEKDFNHPCKKVISSIIMSRTINQGKSWAFANEDFSWMVANQKRCAIIADFISAGVEIGERMTQKSTQDISSSANCSEVENELRSCKQQLSDEVHDARRRGFVEGQTMPQPYHHR